jgi:hypothetical protein
MSLSAVVLAALSFLLALICSWAILLPFFEAERESDAGDTAGRDDSLTQLRLRKEAALDALEDLEGDYLSKRVEEAQYAESKAELTDETAELMNRIESLESESSEKIAPLYPQQKQR